MLDIDKSLECEAINQFLLENGLIELAKKSPEKSKKRKETQEQQQQQRRLSNSSSLSSLHDLPASNNHHDLNKITRPPTDKNKKMLSPAKQFFLNSFMNVLTTLALSISLYLLLANVFLTFYKFQNEFPFSELLTKYECAMHDLTTDECKQINYFNYQYRKLKSEQNQGDNEPLKINTTFFVY